MLMVVFGAGASYDSAPDYPPGEESYPGDEWRPPLAKGLFEKRPFFVSVAEEYGKVTAIIPNLRYASGPIEIELEKLRAETKTYSQRDCQLAAVRYYIRDIVLKCDKEWIKLAGHVTNYRSLLDQIAYQAGEKPLALVTFNYDTLLEEALASCGLDLDRMQAYWSYVRYRLFKLHGSINWSRHITSHDVGLNRSEIIDNATRLKFSKDIVLKPERKDSDAQGLLFPAISIPVQTKDDFECPQENLQVLEKVALPDVDKILVIGWRAQEDNFLDIVGRNLRTLKGMMVVAKDAAEAKEIADRIVSRTHIALRPSTVLFGQGGFTHFIRHHEGDRFFAM